MDNGCNPLGSKTNVGLIGIQSENTFSSSTCQEIFDNKLKLSPRNNAVGQLFDMENRDIGKDKHLGSLEENEVQTMADLLPDNDDLLSGIFEEPEYVVQQNLGDDNFISDKITDSIGGVVLNGQHGSLNSRYANERPYRELPSRILLVRNINPNVDVGELKSLFEQFGDIQTLNTDCKCWGFVIISYYDLRAARNAMCALQNQPLLNQKLDIQFGIPKDNPSEQDSNQGTLFIFKHDSSVSREAIHRIFSVYGEIRQIREIPNTQDQTFIEFYDVRSVEAALHALNQSNKGGLQHSCPQGVKRFPTQQLSPELDLEKSSGCRQGNDSNSSSGCSGSTPQGTHNFTGTVLNPHYPNLMPAGPFMETIFPGETSQERISCSPITVASLGSRISLLGHCDGFQYGLHNSNNMPATHINCRPSSGVYTRYMKKIDTSGLKSDYFQHSENAALGVSGKASGPLHVHHYPNTYYHHRRGPVLSPGSTAFVNTMSLRPMQQLRGLQLGPSQLMNAVCPSPSDNLSSEITSNPLYWRLQRAFPDEPTDPPALQPGSLGNKELSGTFPYGGQHRPRTERSRTAKFEEGPHRSQQNSSKGKGKHNGSFTSK